MYFLMMLQVRESGAEATRQPLYDNCHVTRGLSEGVSNSSQLLQRHANCALCCLQLAGRGNLKLSKPLIGVIQHLRHGLQYGAVSCQINAAGLAVDRGPAKARVSRRDRRASGQHRRLGAAGDASRVQR